MVNSHLVGRVKDALSPGEQVIHIENRDIIVILPAFIRTTLQALAVMSFAYAFTGFANDIIARLLVILIVFLYGKFFLVDFLNYSYEVLALTKTANGSGKAYLRFGFWLRQIHQVALKSLVTTPVKQNRAYYQVLLGLGDVKLDAIGQDGDIFFKDCSRPFELIKLAAELGKD